MSQPALPDHYAALQVLPSAEAAVIEAAYRQLARLYHPDMNDAPDALERMRALNDAYAVLRDPKRRALYDAQRARRGRWSARLAELRQDGDWFIFRLGELTDAFAAITALETAIPADARLWDPASQRWQVHVDYRAVLGQVFTDFDATHGATPRLIYQDPDAPWPYLVAAAVCLIALAIVAYLAQSEPVVLWRRQAQSALEATVDRLAPNIAALGMVVVTALAALVVGYIAWTLRRPPTADR